MKKIIVIGVLGCCFLLGTVSPVFAKKICTIVTNPLYIDILSDKEKTNTNLWLPVYTNLIEQIRALPRPVAHGLTSYDFKRVLETDGLVPGLAEKAYSPKVISLSDLHKEDGLLASLGFANRNDWSTYSVISEIYSGRDVIDRYAEVNSVISNSGLKKYVYKLGLRAVAHKFATDRPMREGEYPIYLIFEISGIETKYVRPHQIPSELSTTEFVPINRLKFALVPSTKVELFADSLIQRGHKDIEVYPIELFELMEISQNRSFVRSAFHKALEPFSALFYTWLGNKIHRK